MAQVLATSGILWLIGSGEGASEPSARRHARTSRRGVSQAWSSPVFSSEVSSSAPFITRAPGAAGQFYLLAQVGAPVGLGLQAASHRQWQRTHSCLVGKGAGAGFVGQGGPAPNRPGWRRPWQFRSPMPSQKSRRL